ncbi:Hypothetical protein D9617_22g066940 [Elsinoe fawcettii]|nr:Hypothetical protein D9617_22g066940 [Elsinoe fawcettii]
MSQPHFFLTGATGRQGSSVLATLLSSGIPASRVYILTRDTTSPSAQRLLTSHPDIHLIAGSPSSTSGIFSSIPSPILSSMRVFLMLPDTTIQSHDGPAFITAASLAGVKHIVYSSVDRGVSSDTEPSTVPKWAQKHQVELFLKQKADESKGKLTYSIIRPVFFMENLTNGFVGKVIATGWRDRLGSKKMQVVAAKDVGMWGARALLGADEEAYRNRAFSVAGDEIDWEDVARVFRREVGREVETTFSFVAGVMIWGVAEVNRMFAWFGDVKGSADLGRLRQMGRVTGFEEWAREVGRKEKGGK